MDSHCQDSVFAGASGGISVYLATVIDDESMFDDWFNGYALSAKIYIMIPEG